MENMLVNQLTNYFWFSKSDMHGYLFLKACKPRLSFFESLDDGVDNSDVFDQVSTN